MASRYIPSDAGFVEPVEEPNWGDDPEPPSDSCLAQSELSMARSRTGPAPMHGASRSGPAGKGGLPPLQPRAEPGAARGGFSENELAAYAYDDDDEWGHGGGQAASAPAQQRRHYGPGNYGGDYCAEGAVASAADDEFTCPTCGVACSRRTSNTPKNPGRVFFKCQQCNLFKWADEVGAAGGSGGGGGGGSGYSPNKRRATSYGSQHNEGGYQPGFGSYGGGGGGLPPVPGSNTFQAAADGGALRDRSNDECYKCHGTGHWASNCPNQGNNGGYGGGGSNFAGSRYKADGAGSTWGGPQGGAGAFGSGGRSNACFKCGHEGHWGKDCPNNGNGGGGGYGGGGGSYSGAGGGGGGYGGGGCFNCGETTHWSKDCPTRGGGGGGGYSAGGGKRKWDGGGGGGYGKGKNW